MVNSARVQVINEAGLHVRTAGVFVAEAARFSSAVQVRNASTESAWVDAKSILAVLTLGVEPGHDIEIRAQGPDDEAAVAALRTLIASDFAGKLAGSEASKAR